MKIGGLLKFSLLDYPGKMSAVLFTQGCNFRCPYCNNPDFALPNGSNGKYPINEVIEFLEKNQRRLEGVVLAGGEPTIHSDLGNYLSIIKSMGYSVKLNTNGSNPGILKMITDRGLVDYIAMEVKAPPEKYDRLAGLRVNIDNIEDSIRIILNSGVEYQFRTTMVNPFLDRYDLSQISRMLKNKKSFVLQKYNLDNSPLDPVVSRSAQYSDAQIRNFQNLLSV